MPSVCVSGSQQCIQGLSYTLSSLTIPTLLTLPSAETAAQAFDALTATATRHLRSLSSISSSAFALAYLFSPRPYRHPYLLYASALALGSHLAASDLLAPYLISLDPATVSASASRQRKERQKQKKERLDRMRMEASYEMLGVDAHSEGSVEASGEELEGEESGAVNGEEVRAEVETFLKKQIVRSAFAGLGFLLSVVGIWGDGVGVVSGPTIVVEA